MADDLHFPKHIRNPEEPTEFGSIAIDVWGDVWWRIREDNPEYCPELPWVCSHSLMSWDTYGKYVVEAYTPVQYVKRIQKGGPRHG